MSPSSRDLPPTSASLERSGAVITAAFALVWALSGALAITIDAATAVAVVGAVLTTAVAIVVALRSRDSGRATGAELPAGWRRRFDLIGAVQGVGIALVVLLAVATGEPGLIPSSVCLVVGLHFFPLASVLRLRYRPVGVALCLVGIAGAVCALVLGADRSLLLVGGGAALVLWVTSFRHSLTGLSTAADHGPRAA